MVISHYGGLVLPTTSKLTEPQAKMTMHAVATVTLTTRFVQPYPIQPAIVDGTEPEPTGKSTTAKAVLSLAGKDPPTEGARKTLAPPWCQPREY